MIAIMAPTCKPFGRWAACNYWRNHDTWKASYDDAAPHGRLCGELALIQIEQHAFFVNEQPEGSRLYDEPPWPRVRAHPTVDSVVFDQCQLGLRDRKGGILRKATELVGNCPEVLRQFWGLRCPGRHQHVHIEGHNSQDAQIWPWRMAERIVQGIMDLRRRLRAQPKGHFLPFRGLHGRRWQHH